jgi:hypothetical protein
LEKIADFLIQINFSDECPMERVALAIDSGFGGYGVVYAGQVEREIYLRPFVETYSTLKAQLAQMKDDCELTFFIKGQSNK